MQNKKNIVLYVALTIVGVYFLVEGLIRAKAFLAPLVTAFILALLMIPVSRWLEKKKWSKLIASLISTLMLLLISISFVAVVLYQVTSFVEDWETIKSNVLPKIEQLEMSLYEHTSIEKEQVEAYKEENDITSIISTNGAGQKAVDLLNGVLTFITDYLLVFIYVFFLVYYRSRFKQFILMLFSKEQQDETSRLLSEITQVGQDYLKGKLILILFLCVLYSIGLGLSGVHNFILVSVIAAVLTLIPYLGNMIGMLLAISFGFVIDGEVSVLIGILITFTVVQFVESYIFEPYVVGDKVDLHPFFVILAIIVGNYIWGIIGMILAIPVLGIINVILYHIDALKPFAYLLSNNKIKGKKERD